MYFIRIYQGGTQIGWKDIRASKITVSGEEFNSDGERI